MTLTIVNEHLCIIDDLHLRELLLLAKDCVEYGDRADATEANHHVVVTCFLVVNLFRSVKHGLSSSFLLG